MHQSTTRRVAALTIIVALGCVFALNGIAQTNNKQQGGAAGLVAAVLQIATGPLANNNQVDVSLIRLDRSLNNLTALNNVLNNSPVLSQNNVDITVQDIQALNNNEVLKNFLNKNNIAIGQVVGVGVLGTGNAADMIVFQQGKTKGKKK